MRITIVAIGTRGDVQPLIAIGLGLQQAGYAVTVATHPNFAALVESFKLIYCPLDLDIEHVLHSEDGKEWLTAGRNIFKTATQLSRLWKIYFDKLLPDIQRACEGAEAILFSYLGMGASHVAEKLNIPCVGTWPTPVSIMPNQDMSIALPGPWTRIFNGKISTAAHYATEQLIWYTFGKAQNDWREKLGLKPIRFPGIINYFKQKKIPFLYGFSPIVVPRPSTWPSWLRISGYWLIEKEVPWEPSKQLCEFLEKGSTPYYIGFGSMVMKSPESLGNIAIEALASIKARGIISTGWTGLKAEELNKTLPSHVIAVDYVPHNWLFSRVKALVHHGGASTTGAALQSGKPSTVVHFFADQAFWGDRLHALGAGTKPISFQRITRDKLTQALTQLETDQSLHKRALELSTQLAAEDGVRNAVESIAELISQARFVKQA